MSEKGAEHEDDRRLMRQALTEARRGGWRTHPNPMVGAVIVREGEVLATGYHEAAGLAHAEVAALSKLDMSAEGADIYVTLEPCNHFARTPPCTRALIEAGIKRCVIGTVDPDPRVSGRGIAALREAGIEVVVGTLEDECRALNAPFFKRITEGSPYLTLKLAMSLDGKVATRTGHSRWITGPAARRQVHEMRAANDAVLVGTGTLLADDPLLTAREVEVEKQPLRVVLDRQLRASRKQAVFKQGEIARTLLVTSKKNQARAQARFEGNDEVAIAGVDEREGVLDLRGVMAELVSRGITTVLCEGGAELAGGLLDAGLVDEIVFFYAPKLIGGRAALSAVGGLGLAEVSVAANLEVLKLDRVGPDIRVRARVQPAPKGE